MLVILFTLSGLAGVFLIVSPSIKESHAQGGPIVQDVGIEHYGIHIAKQFTNTVNSGDVIEAMVGCDTLSACGSAGVVTDTFGIHYYGPLVPGTSSAGGSTSIYYAYVASHSGTDNVSFYSGATATYSFLAIYELSGVNMDINSSKASSSAYNNGNILCCLLSSSLTLKAVTLAVAANYATVSDLWTATSGSYTFNPGATPTIWGANSEDSTTATGSSTLSMSHVSGSSNWGESAVTYALGSVTQPLKICLEESSAGSGSFGLSGGSVSPSTATGSYGCTTTSLTINPSSTVTVTVPTDSTYYRYRMNSTSTSATTEQFSSCASGTCATIQVDSYEEVYYDFSLTPSAPATWDNAYSETATGTAIGGGSQTLATVTLSSGGGAANSHGWGDIGTTATLPASFASAVSGTWQSSGSYSFTLSSTSGGTANTNYNLLDSLTEIVTIAVTPSGPTGTFAISGCDTTAATIQSDGSPHTFHADYSCLLTFTKPTDGANTRYRFGGSVGTWTYTTGASGTDTKSSPVYYEESQGVSYSRTCVSSATCSTVPTFAYTVAGSSNKYFLTTSSTPVYVDSGTTATVNATLTDNLGDVYSTSPYSWVISGVNTVTNPAVYSAGPTTLPIKACDLSPLGTHATLTITGGSPSPGTVPADCSSHNVTINPSTSVTVSLQSATNSTRYFFKDLTTSVALTTCASGSCSLLNKTYFEQFVIVEGDPTPDLILTGINNGSIYSADQVRTWFDAGTNFTVNGLSAGIWRASLTSWIYQEPAQGFQLLANRTLGNIYFVNYGVQFTGAKAYVRFLIPITWTLEEVETGATSSSLSSIPYSQFENPQEIAFSGALAYWNVLMYLPTSPPPPCYSCGGGTTATQTTTATSISTIISTTGSNGSGSLGIGQPGGNLTQPLAVTSPIPQVPQGLFIIALVLILIMLLAIAAVSRRREFETAGDQIKAELRSSSSIGPLSLGNRAKPRKKKS